MLYEIIVSHLKQCGYDMKIEFKYGRYGWFVMAQTPAGFEIISLGDLCQEILNKELREL